MVNFGCQKIQMTAILLSNNASGSRNSRSLSNSANTLVPVASWRCVAFHGTIDRWQWKREHEHNLSCPRRSAQAFSRGNTSAIWVNLNGGQQPLFFVQYICIAQYLHPDTERNPAVSSEKLHLLVEKTCCRYVCRVHLMPSISLSAPMIRRYFFQPTIECQLYTRHKKQVGNSCW